VEIGDNAVVISRDGQIQRVQIGGPRPFHGFHAGGRGVFPGPLPQVRERLEDLPALTPEARDQLKKRLDGARIKIDKSKIKKDAGDRAPGRQRPAPQRAPAVAGPATGVDL